MPSPEVPTDEIDAQIDRIRSQYGELTGVKRAAADEDYVTIGITGTQDGEEVDDAPHKRTTTSLPGGFQRSLRSSTST